MKKFFRMLAFVVGVFLVVIVLWGVMYSHTSFSFVDTTQKDKEYLYQVIDNVVVEDAIKIFEIPEDVEKNEINSADGKIVIFERGDYEVEVKFLSDGTLDISGESIRTRNIIDMIVTSIFCVIVTFVGIIVVIGRINDYRTERRRDKELN